MKPLLAVCLGPLVQLPLDVEYPQLRVFDARPQHIAIQHHTPPSAVLPTCCPLAMDGFPARRLLEDSAPR